MVSNNIISTRNLSEALLCGLAKVEFIRTCTQVGKMIAADNFRDWTTWSWWDQHLIYSTSSKRDIFREQGIQFMTDASNIYLSQAFSCVTLMRWEVGRHKSKLEKQLCLWCQHEEPYSCWDKHLECQFHYGKSLLVWETRIERPSMSLHLNLPGLCCIHTKWQPFPPPTGAPGLSWAPQLEGEFAERWHTAWLGCSLDSCPDRRSAAQVLDRKQAKHCAGFPIGLSDKILCICLSQYLTYLLFSLRLHSLDIPLNLWNVFELCLT